MSMQRMSLIKSVMLFNERVLHNGNLHSDEVYTMEELKSKIFFNKIFIENMQEVFQKHSCNEIINDYVNSLNQYIQNIYTIIDKIEEMDPSIQIDREDSFERRLTIEKMMDDQLITHFYPSIHHVNYRFLNNILYYVTLLKNGYVAISYVDPRRSLYKNIISHEFNGYTKYWKSDDSILSYINKMYQENSTIVMRVTTSIDKDSNITKVEYNGSGDDMRNIIKIFPSEALIVSNPFIYIDDIKRIIESQIFSDHIKVQQNFENIKFEDIFQKDILIEYPMTSFDVYLELLSLASVHREVNAIYISLYRIGDNPVIYYILKEAVKHGIKVHVNIELYASGELINKMWVLEMRNVGIHVTTYASGELKVHSKITLIQFNNGRYISQIGTGNYQAQTTTQYTDLSLITSDDNICKHILKIFQIFDNGNPNVSFNKNLLVTRYNARRELIKLIKREAELGERGYVAIKCNAIDDQQINRYLDEAAKSGCRIDLIVRGVCTWVPDQLGYNVRIKSIIWDKLEHSRVYCFGNPNPTIYIGSLDLVTNKLDKRIETLVRILDPQILENLCEYMNQYIINSKNSWILLRSGEYRKEIE